MYTKANCILVHSRIVQRQRLYVLVSSVSIQSVGHRGIVFVPPPVHLLQHAVTHPTGFPVDLTVEKRSPIGSVQKSSVTSL